jgi:spore maturation protein CgeB
MCLAINMLRRFAEPKYTCGFSVDLTGIPNTHRCFEIPACGRLLLSGRTKDLQRTFKEDEEAVCFFSRTKLVEKGMWLRHQPDQI